MHDHSVTVETGYGTANVHIEDFYICSLFDVVVKFLLFSAELFDDGELECYVEGSIRGQNQRRYAHFP